MTTIAVVGATSLIALSALSWQRSGWNRGTGLLECMRIVLGILAAVTLLQPEWMETIFPTEKPVLAVVHDDSLSMDTRDVLAASDTTARARRQWIGECLTDALWKELRETMDVVVEPLSATVLDRAAGTDLNGGLDAALRKHANLRAVVLLSDGDWNMGESPVTTSTRLRLKGVPVFAIGVGSEVPLPDIEITSFDLPTFSVVGKSLQVPFRVHSTLPRDYQTVARLRIDDGSELTKEITIPAKGAASEAIFWVPEKIGQHQLQLRIPQHPDEVVPDNNEESVTIAARAESLRVLVVESVPRWEYRYLRNALQRDPGVEVTCLLFHPDLSQRGGGRGYLDQFPATREILSRYDVVFLGDVGVGPGQLSHEHCHLLKGLVEEQASGLVFLPGMHGWQFSLLATELKELYPVVLDSTRMRGFSSPVPNHFVLTQSGRRSLLTKLADSDSDNMAIWQGLPGFYWRSPAVRAKAGTNVLAVHEDSRAPLLVTKTFGTGTILFMGTDGAWRWREGVEDRYHYRFWGQVARWMAYQRHMAEGEMLRLFYSPDRPEPGNTVTLHATISDPTGAPYNDGTVTAEVTDPQRGVERLRFRATGKDWGLYNAQFFPEYLGSYHLRLTCQETSAVLETEILVQGQNRERIGKPARHDVTREIAEISHGVWLATDQWKTIRDQVLSLPPAAPITRRHRIWASPYWAGLLIGLMCLFWIGRKLKGTI